MAGMTDGARILGAAVSGGLTAPFYLALILGLGALEPGFSHLRSPMSELGGVPGWRGSAFNIGVAATGVLVLVFAAGFERRLPAARSARAGTALLVTGGLGLIGVGVFHCDPDCRNVLADPDWIGRVHILSSLLAGMGTGLAPLFLWAAMRRSPRWADLAPPTLAMGVLANLSGLAFWLSLLADYRLHAVEGLVQRLGLVLVFLWMGLAAARLGRLTHPGGPKRA